MNQLESKFGLARSKIQAIQNIFLKFPKIEKVFLYGSRAKGNFRIGSDIDLCLYGNKLNYSDLVAIEMELDDLMLPYTIDLSIYHLIDNSDLVEHINRVGLNFYPPS